MIGILPTVSYTDLQGVLALAAFSADPKACTDRLAELNSLANDLQDKSDQLGFAKKAFEDEKNEYSTRFADLKESETKVAETQKRLDEMLSDYKLSFFDLENKTKEQEASVLARTKDLDSREAVLKARDLDNKRLQDNLNENLEINRKLKSDLETKLNQLKAISA